MVRGRRTLCNFALASNGLYQPALCQVPPQYCTGRNSDGLMVWPLVAHTYDALPQGELSYVTDRVHGLLQSITNEAFNEVAMCYMYPD